MRDGADRCVLLEMQAILRGLRGRTDTRIGAISRWVFFESICAARSTDKWPKWTLYKEKTKNTGFARAKAERERCLVGRRGRRKQAHYKHARPSDWKFPTLQTS